MNPERRVWVLPAVLAVLVLSMPVQVMFATRVGEPYPGLFQPAFHGDSQGSDQVVKFQAVRLSVDGRRVRPIDVLPVGNAKDALATIFPPRGDHARIDDRNRRSMRSALKRRLGTDPRELSVRWERRRFHLDTGKTTRGKRLATYRVDLRGGSS